MASTWHAMETEKALHALQSDLNGLSDEEAVLRSQKFGYNELVKKKRVSRALHEEVIG